MGIAWYYSTKAKGQIYGPCTSEDLQRRVQEGFLSPDDLVWLAGADPRDAVAAEAVLVFPKTPEPDKTSGLPDWLADVGAAEERIGPVRREWRTSEMPDWVDDLRRLQGLPPLTERPTPAVTPSAPVDIDWTNAVTVPPELIPDGMTRLPREAKNTAIAAEVSAIPSEPSALPSDAGSMPLSPLAPPPPAAAEPLSGDVNHAAAPWFALSSGVAAQNAQDTKTRAPSAQTVETARTASVIDERQGESAQEAFQRAQFALQQWADLDVNHDLILSGDLDAVRSDVAIGSIVRLVDKHSSHLAQRFWKHLEFVLDNRRKYFEAVARANRRPS